MPADNYFQLGGIPQGYSDFFGSDAPSAAALAAVGVAPATPVTRTVKTIPIYASPAPLAVPAAAASPVYGQPQTGFFSFLAGLFSNSSPPPAPAAVPYTKDQSILPATYPYDTPTDDSSDWLSSVMDPGIGQTYTVTPLPNLPAPSLPNTGLSATLAPIISAGRKILPVLKSSSNVSQSGGSVKSAQSILNQLGYNSGSVDGLNGPQTTAAVKAFQSANGLTVDGIIGPQTTAALAKASTSKAAKSSSGNSGNSNPSYTFNTGNGGSYSTKSPTGLVNGQTPNEFGNIMGSNGQWESVE